MIQYFERLLKILDDSIHSMDENMFQQLVNESVETIDHGKKIVITGLGKNVPICEKFVGTMISMGMPAYFLNTNSAVHGDIGIVKEDDLVILLTKSGETIESVYLTEHLQKRKSNIWLLSFEEDSTLARRIPKRLILNLEHEGDMWNIMPNNSTTLNLIVLQALAMNIAKKKQISLEEFKQNHPGGHIGQILSNEDKNE